MNKCSVIKSMKDNIKSLKKYTTDELQEEISRRETIEFDNKKDRTQRPFYRIIVAAGTAIKDKLKILNALTEDQREGLREEDGHIYLLDKETPEEVLVRLSRTASVEELYDQSMCVFYENGKEIAKEYYGSYSQALYAGKQWECDKWEKYFIEEYKGRSSWYPIS